MNAMWSEARVKVSHRLAMHLHVDLFRLRNATPMVSFTFDDLPKSAVTTGAGLLEARGARGTFYVSGGLVSVGTSQWETGDSSDVLALHRNGHEIGCHTFSHQRACDLDETSLMKRSRATGTTSARSIPESRSLPLPTRSATAHSRASSSSNPHSGLAAASCPA